MGFWTNIKNVVSATTDIIIIGTKEISYHATKASNATESVTGALNKKAASVRARYEADLADRKAGVKKPAAPTVVTETPADAVIINN